MCTTSAVFTCVHVATQQLKKGDEFVLKENRLYCKEDYTKEHTVDTQKGTKNYLKETF